MKRVLNLYERILKADLIIHETRQHLLLELKLGDDVFVSVFRGDLHLNRMHSVMYKIWKQTLCRPEIEEV